MWCTVRNIFARLYYGVGVICAVAWTCAFAFFFGYELCVRVPATVHENFTHTSWPSTLATVQRSDMQVPSDKPGRNLRRTWHFKADFQVNGERHSTQVWREPSGMIPDENLKKFPKGSLIRVRYNPSDPSMAFAGPGMGITVSPYMEHIGRLAGLLAFAMGGFLLIPLAFERWREPDAEKRSARAAAAPVILIDDAYEDEDEYFDDLEMRTDGEFDEWRAAE